jgi:hypothetical protein
MEELMSTARPGQVPLRAEDALFHAAAQAGTEFLSYYDVNLLFPGRAVRRDGALTGRGQWNT